MEKIITKHLILREFQDQDAGVLKENWIEYMQTHKVLSAGDLELIEGWVRDYGSRNYAWVAEHRESGATVGNINVIKMSKKHRYCEVAYTVNLSYRNQGFATEMLRGVIEFLLYEKNFHVVEAKHYSDNFISGKVMKNAGMNKEAELVDRRYNFKTHKFENLICYSVISNSE